MLGESTKKKQALNLRLTAILHNLVPPRPFFKKTEILNRHSNKRQTKGSKMSEDELEHLKRKVEELEKKTESIVYVINVTNQVFKSLFEQMLSLLEKMPKNIAKEAVELKKDFRKSEEILQKAQKNSYVD